MNFFSVIIFSLFLVSFTNIAQAQFPAWANTYWVLSNPACNQAMCCCIVGPINITMAATMLTLNYNIQGSQCNSGGMNGTNNATPSTTTVPLPSASVIASPNLGFTTTDSYMIILSSDSNTLSINDTTNQQCTSIAQTSTPSTTTTPVAPIVMNATMSTTITPMTTTTMSTTTTPMTTTTMSTTTTPMATSTMSTTSMWTTPMLITTSQQPSGSGIRHSIAGFYLFLGVLMAHLL